MGFIFITLSLGIVTMPWSQLTSSEARLFTAVFITLTNLFNSKYDENRQTKINIYIYSEKSHSGRIKFFFFLVKEKKSKIELISQKSTSVFSSSASFCNQNT